ncbi:hypothetical protein [Pseudomonas sp. RIT-PI-S]|uniref:hypothetical protein n=1 Tax=Pseudomonas sp. RIT-PI-S TaxID=3035295 RepID=UPI0021D8F7DD|nr:hypothetical protein [Pseudomonas sp. RIT-PI-S]
MLGGDNLYEYATNPAAWIDLGTFAPIRIGGLIIPKLQERLLQVRWLGRMRTTLYLRDRLESLH